MSHLALVQDEYLNKKGEDLSEGLRPIKVLRASIYDRNNVPLATTIKRYDLYGLKGLKEGDVPIFLITICHILRTIYLPRRVS